MQGAENGDGAGKMGLGNGLGFGGQTRRVH